MSYKAWAPRRAGPRTRHGGFTLLEIMIVVFIIAILFAIMTPNWIKAKYRAHLSSCMNNERAIVGALETYRTENDTYPNAGVINPGHVIFTGRYIQPGEVRCPSSQNFYTLETNADGYTVWCNGVHHLLLQGVAAGFPQYTPGRGLVLQP